MTEQDDYAESSTPAERYVRQAGAALIKQEGRVFLRFSGEV